MFEFTCKKCGKIFQGKSSKRKFCSQRCYFAYDRTPPIKCEWCKKEFSPKRRVTKFGPVRFCSRNCSNQSTNKIRREMRIFNSGGYVSIYVPDHPNAYCGRVREHVLVIEKLVNRFLVDNEEVHHVNRFREDNRPENLFLCKNHKEHQFLEKIGRILETEFIHDKGLSGEFTEYVNDKFLKSYKSGDYCKYQKMTAKQVFELLFGKTNDKGKLRRFLFERKKNEDAVQCGTQEKDITVYEKKE